MPEVWSLVGARQEIDLKRVLVLGAYGFVGSHVARALTRAGHGVVALGRDSDTARRVLPGYTWVFRDLRNMTSPRAWQEVLEGIDVVVNCAGALQDNLQDDLVAVHLNAIGALVLACEKSGAGLVHLSAAGADPSSKLRYYRTKAEGDALIRESTADWWIFRPGLVLAQTAFGLSAVYRMQSSLPYILPLAGDVPDTRVIAMSDLVCAVERAVDGKIPSRTQADLVSSESYSTNDLARSMRRWLGFEAARFEFTTSLRTTRLFTRLADAASWFGWRAPYRSTAVDLMTHGADGNPKQTEAALGRAPLGLSEIFLTLRAGTEERLRTRMLLLGPYVFLTLAVHWIVAGLIAMTQADQGIGYMLEAGHGPFLSRFLVYLMAFVTLALGVSLMVRRMAHRALVIMAVFSVVYLVAATAAIPSLWLDPLGPLVKVFPIIVLTLLGRVIIDSR